MFFFTFWADETTQAFFFFIFNAVVYKIDVCYNKQHIARCKYTLVKQLIWYVNDRNVHV